MNNKKITWVCFGLMVLVQLWTPASVIWNRENILKNGTAFKFLSAPVDPSDPFRGKYIILDFSMNSYIDKERISWENGETVYVQLTTDTAGYATIHSLHKSKPAQSMDYVKTTINYIRQDSLNTVMIEWPFERFYMEESKAYDAELAYRRAAIDSNNKTYGLVKVKNGEAVLENVFINNIPIATYIKK